MAKVKHSFCIAALVAALAAPVAQAEETAGLAGLLEAWLGQLEALWQADEAPPAAAPAMNPNSDPGDQPELGPAVPING